jgi:hypothetical protein
MGRNARILEKKSWFLGKDDKQEYPISYRYVICYALLSFLSENKFNKQDALEKLETLRGAIEDGKTSSGTGFLDVFVLEEGWGFVVVDQTGGVYPRVLYSKRRKKVDADERIAAFRASLDDVIDKFERIYSYFKRRKADPWKWDRKFQEKLFKEAGFTYQE